MKQLIIKKNKETLYWIEQKTILKLTKKYEEKKQKINIENYLKKKDVKRKSGRNRYLNMSQEKKQKLKEYQKNYH